MTTNTDTQAHGGGVEAVREAHKKWWSTRGGIGMACFASSGDQERAFAKADKDFAFAVAAILAASPAAPAPAAGVEMVREAVKSAIITCHDKGYGVAMSANAAEVFVNALLTTWLASPAPDAKGER